VADSANDADLEPVVAAARRDPAFLASRMSLAGAEQALGARLNLDRSHMQRLLLCRPPTRSRFAAEVTQMADLVGTEPAQLAALLREVEAVGGLRGLVDELPLDRPGLLTAARDAEDAHVTSASERAERLRELAAAFWDEVPRQVRDARDFEAAATWSMPLAVIVMSPLTLAGIRDWFADHEIPVAGDQHSGRVQGFLVAWRGVGIVFCDGTADAAERRFTLAHEVGHFLLDYDRPRRRVLRDAPELLEVVDGVRRVTPSDRAQALLARVPLGVHTQVLDDSRPGQDDPAGEDEASRFALEVLAPWHEVIAAARDLAAAPTPYRETLGRATSLISGRFVMPPYAARARARQALETLGVRPGFFDR
jgi:hypothetical protein